MGGGRSEPPIGLLGDGRLGLGANARRQNGRVWSESALGARGPGGAGTVLANLSLFIVTIVVGLAAGALSVHWFGL